MVLIYKLLFLVLLVFAFPIQTHAIGVNASKYFNSGYIYSGSKYPQSVANNTENTNPEIERSSLKQGASSSRKFFGLIELGNASIDKAVKTANITKIHYVDISLNKVYVPYFIIPISAMQKTTIVYGE